MANRILRVFSDVYMGYGHPALSDMIKKYRKSNEIEPGEMFIFINKKKTAAKVYAANETIFYIRPRTGFLEMSAIIELPKAIGIDGTLNYNKALENALVKKVAK